MDRRNTILDLTGRMTIKDQSHKIEYETLSFPDGQPHIKLKNVSKVSPVLVIASPKNMEDFIMIALTKSALDETGHKLRKTLRLLYMPGARQDRVCNPGEPFTLKVFCNMINNMAFHSVQICHPHSEITRSLLWNPYEYILSDWQANIVLRRKNIAYTVSGPDGELECPILIAPDKGAAVEVKHLPAKTGLPHLSFEKVRRPSDGVITGMKMLGDKDLGGRNCVIVDDICDGGRTFIECAKILKEKGANDIFLVVTHGIFSKGFKELSKYFKGIYTSDSIRSNISMECPEIEEKSEIVTVCKLFEL